MGCLPLKVHSAPSVEVGGHIYPCPGKHNTVSVKSDLVTLERKGGGGGDGGGIHAKSGE